MLSTKFRVFSFAVIVFAAAAVLFVYPVMRGELASPSADDLQKEMDAVKQQIEKTTQVSPQLLKRYGVLADALGKCNTVNQVTEPTIKAPFSPAASLCINGALAVADPNYNRVLASSTGTGVGTGVVGNCSLSGSGTATEYDSYGFNLTGCAAFPTVVTFRLCNTGTCVAPNTLDSVMTLYRNVAAGDPLTANGGLPGVFNPAAACTNARAANDDSGTTPTSTGGSTCNQSNTADCLPQCVAPASTANSEMKRNLGNGRFTLVITGFGNTTVGNYNLWVDAPAAGCAIALAPTSANGGISGRVTTSTGQGISKAMLTISGSEIAPMTLSTNGFGYYNFPSLPSGVYTISVSSKMYTFANPTQVITVDDNVADINFVSEQ